MTGLPIAAEALIAVRLLVPSGEGMSQTVGVELRAQSAISATSSAPLPISRHLNVRRGADERHEFRVTPGAWKVDVVADGYWSPPQILSIHGESTKELVVRLYRTVPLRVPIVEPTSAQGSIAVDFRGVAPAGDKIPEGLIDCPIDRGHLTCSIPVGTLDLRFEVKGFVPEYRWSQELIEHKTNSLPGIRLARGASVSGFVRAADGKSSEGIVAELLTLSGDSIAQSLRSVPRPSTHSDARVLQAVTNDRGFFQIRTVPRGEFQVVARRAGAMAVANAQVEEGSETRLRDFLVLEPTVDLTVSVEPTVAPDGMPWRLRVVKLKPYREALHERTVPADRPVVVPVSRGVYSLELLKAQDRWFIQSVAIEGPPPPVTIRLPITRVKGQLSLGKEPLAGRVVFGGANGAKHVAMAADEDGVFEGTLPHDGDWPVTIEADEPRVRRTLHRVAIVPDAAGEAPVTIALPDTRLRGRVVDERGGPVLAFVTAIADGGHDRPVQIRVERNETFSVRGLPEGDVRLEAEAEGGRRSALMSVTLGEDEERTVTLVVKDGRTVEGRLQSAEGVPVAGGSILAFENGLHSGSRRYITDAEGQFTLSFGPAVRHLMLVYWGEGYATRVSSAVVSGDPLLLTLERQGGSLILDFGREVDVFDAASPFQGVVSSGGAQLPISLLFQITAMRGLLSELPSSPLMRSLRLPQMNSGTYSLCVQNRADVNNGAPVARSQCISETVQPGGEARLALASQSWP
jgi:hypothetical protein